jgi:hypothetical protein
MTDLVFAALIVVAILASVLIPLAVIWVLDRLDVD